METSQNADEGGKSSKLSFKEGIILTDMDLITCIFNIIEKTEKYCFIVTPFLESPKKWVNLGKQFNKVYNDGKKLFFILKKPSNEFKDDREKHDREEIETIKKDFNGKFDLFFVDYLHSKIYLNEKQVLITSINLKTYAMEKNHEIGCLIDDPDISKQIVNNIIIKNMLKNNNTEHIDGKWAEWINKVINNGKISDDGFDNNDNSSIKIISEEESNNQLSKNDNLSNDSSIKENKAAHANDNLENNDNPSFGSNLDSKNLGDNKQGHCIYCNKLIPFNKKKPACEVCLSDKSLHNGNFCHKCGGKYPGRSKYNTLCYHCYRHN